MKLIKRTLSVLSCAALLCGSAAIPASAAENNLERTLSKDIKTSFSDLGDLKNPDITGKLSDKRLPKDPFIPNVNSFEIDEGIKQALKYSESCIRLDKSEDFVYEGETTTIEVIVGCLTDIAMGNGTIMYQWYDENGAIEGATGSTYTTGEAGCYYCDVWNTDVSNTNVWRVDNNNSLNLSQYVVSMDGIKSENTFSKGLVKKRRASETVTTGTCVITKINALAIINQPVSGVFKSYEEGYTLNVDVTGGAGPYTYEWFEGNDYVGTGPAFTVNENGNYYCIITDANGRKVKSEAAAVKGFYFKKNLPVVTNMMSEDQTVEMSVAIDGYGKRYQYIWQAADIGSDKWVTIYTIKSAKPNNSKKLLLKSYLNKKIRCKVHSLNADGKIDDIIISDDTVITEPIELKRIENSEFYDESGRRFDCYKVEGGYGKYSFYGFVNQWHVVDEHSLIGPFRRDFIYYYDEETNILTAETCPCSDYFELHITDEVGNEYIMKVVM